MKLNVNSREIKGKNVKTLRREGLIPAIVYGKHIKEPVMLTLLKNDFIKLYKEAGSSSVITLKGDDKFEQMVLVHDMQLHPVSDEVIHVDFLAVKKGEKVSAEVSLVFEGEAPIEQSKEGQVQIVKDTVEVEALPKDLPHDIKVDLSKLETTSDNIFVKDIQVPKWVTILTDSEINVVTIAIASSAEEEEEEATTEESTTEGEGGEETTETAAE